MSQRIFLTTLFLCCVGLVIWALSFSSRGKADFTFCNGDEVRTLDPAASNGQPEGRIISALFEGLCGRDARDMSPVPGIAKSWNISEDGLIYTFKLRTDARWSNGRMITADDIIWSMRRFLHPETAAEYAFEMWYIKNARKFTLNSLLEPGDPVEIELHEKHHGAPPYAEGKKLYGRLMPKTSLLDKINGNENSSDSTRKAQNAELNESPELSSRIFHVEINGTVRNFCKSQPNEKLPDGLEPCKWVLLDFSAVAFRKLSPTEIEIQLNHPVPYFLSLLSFYPMAPVNRECVEQYGSPNWTKPENIITNGPFLLQQRRIRDRIRLKKNPLYWNAENVHCNIIDALAIKYTTTGMNMYMTGQCEWITTVPTDVVNLLRDRDDFHGEPYLGTYYYVINTSNSHGDASVAKALGDVRVRRALNMALDRNEIVNRVLRGGQIPARSLVCERISKQIPYTPGQCASYNVSEARRLLSEAGYPEGVGFPQLTILYNSMESHRTIAELVQAQWLKNLGIKVRLQNQEWPEYLAKRAAGDFHVTRAGWGADYIDPITFLLLFTSESPQNDARWFNPKYDALLERAKQEPNITRRLEFLHEAEQLMMDEVPVIPIYFNVSQQMVAPEVEGWYSNLLDDHPLSAIRVKKK